MTQNDSGQDTMSSFHSSSPSPSILSNTSRLSQKEIEEILTSPVDTGYTYSQSAAYRRDGSIAFRHPQLCRRYRISPNSSFQSGSTENHEYINSTGKKYKKNIFIRLIFSLLYLLKALIVFSITLIVFISRTASSIVTNFLKQLFFYFIIAPILASYYTVLQYYIQGKYAFRAASQIFLTVKYFFVRSYNYCFQSRELKQQIISVKRIFPLRSIVVCILWILSFGYIDIGENAKNTEVNKNVAKVTVRTRAQTNKFLNQNVKERLFEEDKLYDEKEPSSSFVLLQWLFSQILWPVSAFVWLFSRNNDQESFTSPKFTSTPTIASVFLGKRMAAKRIAAANSSSSFWSDLDSFFSFMGLIILRFALFTVLLFLLYSAFGKIFNGEPTSDSAKLASLKLEIDKLKFDLQEAVYHSEGHRLEQFKQHKDNKHELLDADLDLKILTILERLRASEREARLVELREFEGRVLERARREIVSTVSDFQSTLRDTAAESAVNIARTESSAAAQNALLSTNLSLEKLKTEIDRKIAGFVDKMNVREAEKDSRFLSKLENLRQSMLIERTEKSGIAKNAKKSTISEFDDSVYLAKVRELIKEYIQIYDADKTGIPDFALESSGGSIASIRCTAPYNERSRTQMIFGIPLWYSSYSPRSVIQRKGNGASAGECWAFVGAHGYLTIKLSNRINITSVSYEHLPVQLSLEGHIQTAPREFHIYSYQDVDELDSRFFLGNFTYDDKGEPLQTFKMQHFDPLFTPIIELETISNYGAMVTCLYRFRVHGSLAPKSDN